MHDHGAAREHLSLRNVLISQPTHCMNGKEDVICLVARKEHMHPAAWILTVDMKNAKVQAVEEFAITENLVTSPPLLSVSCI